MTDKQQNWPWVEANTNWLLEVSRKGESAAPKGVLLDEMNRHRISRIYDFGLQRLEGDSGFELVRRRSDGRGEPEVLRPRLGATRPAVVRTTDVDASRWSGHEVAAMTSPPPIPVPRYERSLRFARRVYDEQTVNEIFAARLADRQRRIREADAAGRSGRARLIRAGLPFEFARDVVNHSWCSILDWTLRIGGVSEIVNRFLQ